jgi:hypothetical protein
LPAISSTVGGSTPVAVSPSAIIVRDMSAWRSKQAGQSACGESSGNGAPQPGQFCEEDVFGMVV